MLLLPGVHGNSDLGPHHTCPARVRQYAKPYVTGVLAGWTMTGRSASKLLPTHLYDGTHCSQAYKRPRYWAVALPKVLPSAPCVHSVCASMPKPLHHPQLDASACHRIEDRVSSGSCTYRRVCMLCQQPHKARDCPRTPESFIYKQPRWLPQQPTATPAAPGAPAHDYPASLSMWQGVYQTSNLLSSR